MSFFKYRNKRGSSKDQTRVDGQEGKCKDARGSGGAEQEACLERRRPHSLSISRSGKYKQLRKDRKAILDKPDLYVNPAAAACASGGPKPPHQGQAACENPDAGDPVRDARVPNLRHETSPKLQQLRVGRTITTKQTAV